MDLSHISLSGLEDDETGILRELLDLKYSIEGQARRWDALLSMYFNDKNHPSKALTYEEGEFALTDDVDAESAASYLGGINLRWEKVSITRQVETLIEMLSRDLDWSKLHDKVTEEGVSAREALVKDFLVQSIRLHMLEAIGYHALKDLMTITKDVLQPGSFNPTIKTQVQRYKLQLSRITTVPGTTRGIESDPNFDVEASIFAKITDLKTGSLETNLKQEWEGDDLSVRYAQEFFERYNVDNVENGILSSNEKAPILRAAEALQA
jgi:hypothetical protein